MQGLSISQASQRSGFSPSALRFYERAGLLHPARTAAGYRSYDGEHLEALAFISRAKRFGFSLDEITELLEVLAQDECAPLQAQMRGLVEGRLHDARDRLTEMHALEADLRTLAESLEGHTPSGACDERCGCRVDASDAPVPVSRSTGGRPASTLPVACTLGAEQLDGRLERWGRLAAGATSTEPIGGGVRLTFPASIDLLEVAALVVAELECCPYFAFAIGAGSEAVTLEVAAESTGRELVDELLGLVR